MIGLPNSRRITITNECYWRPRAFTRLTKLSTPSCSSSCSPRMTHAFARSRRDWVGRWNSRLEDPLKLLRSCIQDEHPRVRLEAIVACSYVPHAKAMEVAATAADQTRDRFIDYALKLCVQALKPHWAPALARGEFDFGEAPERLRLVLKLDGTKDSAQFVRQLTTTSGLSEESREGLFALLAGLGTPNDLQYVMNHSNRSPAVLRELVTVAEVHNASPGRRARCYTAAVVV